MDTLDQLAAALGADPSRAALVVADGRARGAAVARTLSLGGLPPPFDPYGPGRDPFSPLVTDELVARLRTPGRCVVDGSGAPPWDDPVWRAGLRGLDDEAWAGLVLIISPRLRAGVATRPTLVLEPAVALPVGLEALQEAVQRACSTTQVMDDDGPLLREAVLRTRQRYGPAAPDEVCRELAVQLLRLGQYEVIWGTLPRALVALEEAASVARARVAAGADRPERHHDLAAILDELGDVLAALDRAGSSDRVRRESAAVSAARQALQPTHERAAWGRAVSGLRTAGTNARDGRYDAALVAVRRALAAAEGRPAADRAAARVNVLDRLIELLTVTGRLAEAEVAVEDAVATLGVTLATSPRRFDLRAELARLLGRRALLAATGARSRAAALSATEAAAQVQALVAREPTRSDWLSVLARVCVNVADVRIADGLPAFADEPLRLGLRVYDHLLTRDATRVSVVCGRARAERRLGYVHLVAGNVDAARRSFARSGAVSVGLLDAAPDRPDRHHDRAFACMSEAVLYEYEGLRAQARLKWSQAHEHARRVLALAPDTPAALRTAQRAIDGTKRCQSEENG